MYCITDKQVEYILNDIRRNGVEMEDLQLNLLDHVCCIIEQNLEGDDDFEGFYHRTIQQFYKRELREIEDETIKLLTFKNFYKMKKVMIVSGTFSVAAFVIGSVFKMMFWPGASMLIVLGMLTMSFVFLPLLVLLKTRDAGSTRDKLILSIAALLGILYCMSTLFAVQHWPGRSVLWLSTVSLAAFVFIPVYFFTGIRKPETRLNTIVTSILLVGVTGLLFAMIGLRPPSVPKPQLYAYLRNEQLLTKMQQGMSETAKSNTLVGEINSNSEQIKAAILESSIGQRKLPDNIDNSQIYFKNGNLGNDFLLGSDFMDKHDGALLLDKLKAAVAKYNATIADASRKVPTDHSILEDQPQGVFNYTNLAVLNSITQIQMYVATTEMKTPVIAVAAK